MPLYEYVCRDCDQEVEVLVRNPDEQPECPVCGGTQMTKLLSLPAAPSSAGGESSSSCCNGGGCGCSPG